MRTYALAHLQHYIHISLVIGLFIWKMHIHTRYADVKRHNCNIFVRAADKQIIGTSQLDQKQTGDSQFIVID